MRRLLLLLIAGAAFADPLADMVALERDTEALHHRLIELARALQARDGERARTILGGATVRGFPPRPGPARDVHARVRTRTWTPDPDATGGFAAFVGRSLAVTLQPSASRRDGARLVAEVKLRIVRKDAWLRGRLEVVARGGALESVRLLALGSVERPWTMFRDVTEEVGIARPDPAVLDHPTLGLAAYGAAAGDLNGDGRIDLFVTAHDTNHVLLNRGGDRFEEFSLETPRPATAPLLLDFDNDGDLDVFLSANGKQMLFESVGSRNRLAFRDVSEEMGVAVETIGFSVAAADVNGDRRPDLYVTSYNNYGPVAPESWVDGRNGLPNLFFVSRPDGTYEEAAEKWGVADPRWSYAAQFADVDGDGKQDLYVANDFGAGNGLFMRRGDRFVDEAEARGVLDSGYGMGVSFGDYDNDGILDLHVTRMSSTAGKRILARLDRAVATPLQRLASGNGLYRGLGGGRFAETSERAGPFQAGWAWGGGFLDIDNDGYEDLYTPNGHLSGAAEKDT